MRDNVRRILVATKYRFIGDTLNAIPTFRAIKERWPEANVTLLSGARACELLDNCPYVDQFIEFDPYRQADKGLGQYVKLLMLLRRQSFDLCFVLNRSFHSALTAALAGAKVRCGWSGFEGRDFLLTDFCSYDREKSEAECFLDVFRTVGGDYTQSATLQLWITDDEIAEAAHSLPSGDILIGIQPGATHEYKQWPLSQFVDVAEQLVNNRPNTKIVLIGGPDESEIANTFVDGSSQYLMERTTNLVGRTSLRSTLATVAQLHGFIGNDTAIRHAAVAADIPSIGLFGPTSWSKWGNSNPPRHSVLFAPSGKMADISVNSVFEIASLWGSTHRFPSEVDASRAEKFHQAYLGSEQKKGRMIPEAPLVLERGMHE